MITVKVEPKKRQRHKPTNDPDQDSVSDSPQ
jgi:hypothetical protein